MGHYKEEGCREMFLICLNVYVLSYVDQWTGCITQAKSLANSLSKYLLSIFYVIGVVLVLKL